MTKSITTAAVPISFQMKFGTKITAAVLRGAILVAITAVPFFGITSTASAALWCKNGNCATVDKCPSPLGARETCAGIMQPAEEIKPSLGSGNPRVKDTNIQKPKKIFGSPKLQSLPKE